MEKKLEACLLKANMDFKCSFFFHFLNLIYFSSEFHVPPPCGTYRECVHLGDGNYPDIEHMCTSFYTCLGGIFLGHTPCAPGMYTFSVYLDSSIHLFYIISLMSKLVFLKNMRNIKVSGIIDRFKA